MTENHEPVTVVVADDQSAVREGLVLLLGTLPGITVLGEAEDGDAAVDLVGSADPDVVLMDEPCSALDPIATGAIEDLMKEIKSRYKIVIVTHNMQQATRVSDRTAFYSVLRNEKSDTRTGVLVEYDKTQKLFEDPTDPRTQAYVTGRMG